MTPKKLSFGKCMLVYRLTKGLTLKELAQKTKVTATALSYYENEKRIPKLTTACAIADALGVTINDLCGYSNLMLTLVQNAMEENEQ